MHMQGCVTIEDVTNTFYQELYDRASQLYSETLSASSFYQPELLSIDEETIQSFLEHEQLQLYRHMFEKLNQQRPHILSSKEESLLAQASEVFSSPEQRLRRIKQCRSNLSNHPK